MDWIVKNALNRDVERQHLNKILAEIRKTVDSISLSSSYDSVEEAVGRMVEGNREAGINVTYDPVRKVLDFAIVPFTLRLEGDVSGTATVNSLGTMVLNTTIHPAARGVEEAPIDGSPYWRQNGFWLPVPNSVFRLADIEDPGMLSMDSDGNIYGVEIEGTVNEVDVENGDGVEGPPVISLSDLENTGEGLSPVKIYTRDSKGRIVGDEDASTDDLPEGTNLYFTEQRARDASVADEIDPLITDVAPSQRAVADALENVVGIPGPPGKDGQIRFTGNGPPGTIVGAEPGDTYMDLDTGDIYKLT